MAALNSLALILARTAVRSGASRLEGLYRGVVILTFGGGVNEMQRDLISTFGLGMPFYGR